jgi:hypothetical protein
MNSLQNDKSQLSRKVAAGRSLLDRIMSASSYAQGKCNTTSPTDSETPEREFGEHAITNEP